MSIAYLRFRLRITYSETASIKGMVAGDSYVSASKNGQSIIIGVLLCNPPFGTLRQEIANSMH